MSTGFSWAVSILGEYVAHCTHKRTLLYLINDFLHAMLSVMKKDWMETPDWTPTRKVSIRLRPFHTKR